mgnify:CR=1 FL=1
MSFAFAKDTVRKAISAHSALGLVCCALLVLAVYQLINMSLELCPAAVTYSGLLASSLGPGWYIHNLRSLSDLV